jgi:hypothetical protein
VRRILLLAPLAALAALVACTGEPDGGGSPEPSSQLCLDLTGGHGAFFYVCPTGQDADGGFVAILDGGPDAAEDGGS